MKDLFLSQRKTVQTQCLRLPGRWQNNLDLIDLIVLSGHPNLGILYYIPENPLSRDETQVKLLTHALLPAAMQLPRDGAIRLQG